MTANLVTCFRILLIPLIIALLLLEKSLWAFALYLLSVLTDALDGYLARKLNQISDLGKFLDPLADKILVISILVVLVWAQNVEPLPVIIIIAREFAVSGFRILKAKEGKIVAASWSAKIKTVLQFVAVGMLMLSLPYAQIALWLAVLASIVSGIEYARQKA